MCWPTYGTILSGTWNLPVTVILHEVPANFTVSHLRVCHWDVCPSAWRRTTDLGIPLDDHRNGQRTFTMPLNLSGLTPGSYEFRISYEIHYTLNGTAREQFQSTGLQACVGSCVGPDRTLPWMEARSWYTGRNYANARLLSNTSCLIRGGQCLVEMRDGSGGSPTVEHIAAIDPNYHAGLRGIELRRGSGTFKGSVTIPSTLSSGAHKLVLVSSDGKNAGVLSLTFNVP